MSFQSHRQQTNSNSSGGDPLGVTDTDSKETPSPPPLPARPAKVELGTHEMLRELRRPSSSTSMPTTATPGSSSSASFPSTGFSRIRKVSHGNVSKQTTKATAALPEPKKEELSMLPHDSLGRKLWCYFQVDPGMADVRDLVADNSTAVLVLSQSAHRHTNASLDMSAAVNDNVLFLDHPLDSDQSKFTTASGIYGSADQSSVNAIGMLPPMEDIMLAISDTDAPRATIFDVLDEDMTASPALVRLRVAHNVKCSLPDGRGVQAMVISGGPLEKSLVVDSAVTTLSSRIYDGMDSVYSTLLPQATESITTDDYVKVDIEQIMQFAHGIEMRTHPVAPDVESGKAEQQPGGSEVRKKLSWIIPNPRPSSSSSTTNKMDVDTETWQALVLQLQEHLMGYINRLDKDTSMCGDIESRRKICVALLECVEKPTMESLYHTLFAPKQTAGKYDDLAQDEQFASKVAALNMADIKLIHLGLDTPLQEDLQQICMEAGQLLNRMNDARCPAEKLKQIVDAHKCVVDRMDRLNERIKGSQTGDLPLLSADGILPLLIYSVIKSNPSRFISNLRYIQRYRTRTLLASQYEYCMTNTQAIASFVDTVDARQLGLSAEVSSSALAMERVMHPALASLHNLLVNNVVSNMGIDVVQGVADGGKKVAVGVYDATLGKLIDTSSQLIFKTAPWKTTATSPTEREMDEKKVVIGQEDVISGVRTVLNDASQQLALPNPKRAPPKIHDKFLDTTTKTEDLTAEDISLLLKSYQELASFYSS